jgi:hypothetical protein
VLAPLFVLNIMQFHHTILFISDFWQRWKELKRQWAVS